MKRILYIFLLFSYFVQGQQPYSVHIDKLKDLPSNQVYCIHQDTKGFVWIASNVGITRYDGFEYITYQSKEQTSLPGSNIMEDKFGRIWYQNFDGYLYYIENDSLKTFKQAVPQGFYPAYISNEDLFYTSKNQVIIYSLKDFSEKKVIPLDYNQLYSTIGLNEDYYLLTDINLLVVNSASLHSKVSYGKVLPKNSFKNLFTDQESVFVTEKYNENNKLYQLTKNGFVVAQELQSEKFIQGFFGNENERWILTTRGVSIYKIINNQAVFDRIILPDYSVSFIEKDKDLNYWLASNINGIHFIPELQNEVISINSKNLHKIEASEKGFYITNLQGDLLEYRIEDQSVHTLYTNKQNSPYTFISYDKLDKHIFLISKEFIILEKGNIQNQTSYSFALKKLEKIDDKYYAYGASDISGIMINPNKQDLASTWDQSFSKFQNPKYKNFAYFFEKIRTRTLCYNKNNKSIYYGTSEGLLKVNSNSIVEIKNKGKSIQANNLLCYNGKIIMLNTLGKLSIWQEENNHYHIHELHDFENTIIHSLKLFENVLYFIADNNLYKMDLNETHYKVNKIYTGISLSEINDYLIQEGVLFMLTNEQLIQFRLKDQIPSSHQAKFYLNYFIVNGKKIDLAKKNSFAYFENLIEVNFSIPSFGNVDEAIYYRMNNEEWRMVPSNLRTLSFFSLSPNTYHLQFKIGKDAPSATWNSYYFKIQLPFWKTLWFWLLLIGLIASAAVFYFIARLRLLKKQNQILKENIALEKNLSQSILTSIKSQMNPHFFYNALNTIQAYIFYNDKENASKYLNKFSKLTRMILEMSEQESICLRQEIESLELYLELEQMRFSKDFSYSLSFDKSLDLDFTEVPSMLIQPYVENAIKHGLLHKKGNKQLTITVEKETDNLLMVRIDDNGIGRENVAKIQNSKGKEYKSFSSSANERRLKIINRENPNLVGVEIIDKKGPLGEAEGTLVLIKILNP